MILRDLEGGLYEVLELSISKEEIFQVMISSKDWPQE